MAGKLRLKGRIYELNVQMGSNAMIYVLHLIKIG
jgi:hypothetical protein